MGMSGPPLACFDKATFDEDGLEFFVCNGGWGLVGVRKKVDPGHSIYVRDSRLAMNLNMRAAKLACKDRQFGVRSDPSGAISFLCQGEEVRLRDRFKVASKSDWQRYDTQPSVANHKQRASLVCQKRFQDEQRKLKSR
jgi:hypothetical protein